MRKREPTNIDKNTKGIILYAQPKPGCGGDKWIILVHNITHSGDCLSINRYVSHDLINETSYLDEKPHPWGQTSNYDLFKPTKKDKKIIMNYLKKEGYKYIPTLNKLVKTI